MDAQTQNLYTAEQMLRRLMDRQFDAPLVTVAGSTVAVPLDRKFASLESIQRYVDGIVPGLRVRARKGADAAHYHWGEIAVPMMREGRWAQREIVILHEIAHHLSQGENHGPRFAGAFLDLVEQYIGFEAAFILRVNFDQAGVRVASLTS